MARIAVLGWGSLIWDPGELAIASRWHVDGPCLPIEFTRKSNGMRVTLVIVPGYGILSRTYWALSVFEDVGAAAENLREREGCTSLKPIHAADGETRWSVGGGNKPDDRVGRTITEWVSGRDGVDVVIWTGLKPKTFNPRSQRAPLASQVITFLRSLNPAYEQVAREYVEKAPASIKTPVRQAIEEELDWKRKVLPNNLFEGAGEGRVRSC